MTMQSSGAITLAQIQTEFGGSNPIAMSEYYRNGAYVTSNNTSVPTSGTISVSNFYGTTFRPQLTYTIAANIELAVINPTTLPGYIAGKTDITIVVNPGVYVYNTVVWNPAMRILAANSGDTITVVNYGFIMGCGGHVWPYPTSSYYGGNAIDIYFPVTINNTYGSAYIGGGGGGGASTDYGSMGGGGAGGGNSYAGGSGGGLGGVGADGTVYDDGVGNIYASGGGGGRIFPGAGGAGGTYSGYPYSALTGKGGGAGGGGGRNLSGGNGGSGGSGSGAGGNGGTYAAAGGGGWGAAGGTAFTSGMGAFAGGAGGKAINLNGNSVVWVSGDTSRVYGSVS